MKCKDLETFLFENPDAKSISEEFEEHILSCKDCKLLFEIQRELVNIKESEVKLNLKEEERSKIFLLSKGESFVKFPFLEEAIIFSLIVSIFFTSTLIFSIHQPIFNEIVQNKLLKVCFDIIKIDFSFLEKMDFLSVTLFVFSLSFSIAFFFKVLFYEKKNFINV